MRASANVADQRNQETLEAVHETLEQIVNKIAELEARGLRYRGLPIRRPLPGRIQLPPRRSTKSTSSLASRSPPILSPMCRPRFPSLRQPSTTSKNRRPPFRRIWGSRRRRIQRRGLPAKRSSPTISSPLPAAPPRPPRVSRRGRSPQAWASSAAPRPRRPRPPRALRDSRCRFFRRRSAKPLLPPPRRRPTRMPKSRPTSASA